MEKKDKLKPDYNILFKSLGEASQLSISFVLFPVIFLLIGVFLDKKFNTVPLFILLGVLVGIILFIFQVKSILKKYQKNK